jgi:hypothetical protein
MVFATVEQPGTLARGAVSHPARDGVLLSLGVFRVIVALAVFFKAVCQGLNCPDSGSSRLCLDG